MNSTNSRARRIGLATVAGAGAVGLLALPGTASANGGGIAQSVDVVLGMPAASVSLDRLPSRLCYDPDGSAGPKPPECKDVATPPSVTTGDDLILAVDYVLSSSTKPSSILTLAGEGVCPGGAPTDLGLIFDLGPATYQPGSSIVLTLHQGTTELARLSSPAGTGQTQYGFGHSAC